MTRQEITNIVYDTLMQNNQHLQLDTDQIDNQECEAGRGVILFWYCGDEVRIDINVRKDGFWL